jgi:hypothetical protein
MGLEIQISIVNSDTLANNDFKEMIFIMSDTLISASVYGIVLDLSQKVQ